MKSVWYSLPALVTGLAPFKTVERGRLPLVTAHRAAPAKKWWVGQVELARVNPVFPRVVFDGQSAKVCDCIWWDDSGASGFTVCY